MYRILPKSEDSVLGYYISGKITEPEIKEIHREIKEVLAEHGKMRLLMHIGDLEMPELKAAWEDLKLTPRYVRDLERLAIIGHETWHEWLEKATSIFTRGEVRYFTTEQVEEAWKWVKEGTKD